LHHLAFASFGLCIVWSLHHLTSLGAFCFHEPCTLHSCSHWSMLYVSG